MQLKSYVRILKAHPAKLWKSPRMEIFQSFETSSSSMHDHSQSWVFLLSSFPCCSLLYKHISFQLQVALNQCTFIFSTFPLRLKKASYLGHCWESIIEFSSKNLFLATAGLVPVCQSLSCKVKPKAGHSCTILCSHRQLPWNKEAETRIVNHFSILLNLSATALEILTYFLL